MAPYLHASVWVLATLDILFVGVALALSFEDFRTGAVPLRLLSIFAALGVASRLFHGGLDFLVWLPALALVTTFGILYLVRPGKMGLADVWVAPTLGLYVGIESVPYALLLSCAGAFLYLLGVHFYQKSRRRETSLRGTRIPFIPFLVLGFGFSFLMELSKRNFTYP